MSILCLLEFLLAVAIIAAGLLIAWWAITRICAALEITISAKFAMILQVVVVLIVAIMVIRAVVSGQLCGLFGLGRLG